MTAWTPDELDAIGNADELRIAAVRPDGTLRGAVPVWVVRIHDDLYVRSYKGADGAWYRGVESPHAGHVQSGGVDKDVTFIDETDSSIGDAIDAAYRGKYSNYSATYVDPMVTVTAREATIKLVPR
jgi:hypothetical protein